MKTVAIVQARMGSTRLPGKSAMLIQGIPLLAHVLKRVRLSKVDQVVLALPQEHRSPLASIASDLGIISLTKLGDHNDLIGRYQFAASVMGADLIVRVPADNPCVDPDEINRIIKLFHATKDKFPDSNRLWSNLDGNIGGNNYPGGLGAEVYTKDFLAWLDGNVLDPRLREHPHLWAMERQRVVTLNAHHAIARPDLRFDVNTQADFDFISGIYAALYPSNPDFRIRDILGLLGEEKHVESNQSESTHP